MPWDGAETKQPNWERSIPYGAVMQQINNSPLHHESSLNYSCRTPRRRCWQALSGVQFASKSNTHSRSHNVCLDRFGAPWPGEVKPLHGEVVIVAVVPHAAHSHRRVCRAGSTWPAADKVNACLS